MKVDAEIGVLRRVTAARMPLEAANPHAFHWI